MNATCETCGMPAGGNDLPLHVIAEECISALKRALEHEQRMRAHAEAELKECRHAQYDAWHAARMDFIDGPQKGQP